MKRWLLLALGCATPLQAQQVPSTDAIVARHDRMTRLADCRRDGTDAIVVCARSGEDRYRLPYRNGPGAEASAPPTLDSHMALAGAAPGSRDQCGIFADQRRCSKGEMVASGWGGGHDPITAIGRIVTGIVDPDRAVEAPKDLPR